MAFAGVSIKRRPKNEDPEARPRTNLNIKLQRPKRFIRWQEMRNRLGLRFLEKTSQTTTRRPSLMRFG